MMAAHLNDDAANTAEASLEVGDEYPFQIEDPPNRKREPSRQNTSATSEKLEVRPNT